MENAYKISIPLTVEMDTGISIQTSFDWRHKLLTSFSNVSVEEFQGIVESDDLFFA